MREEVLAYLPLAWIGQNIFSLRPMAGAAAMW
jgi:long-subunit acyl-CoA synthetase (AMP-forming)